MKSNDLSLDLLKKFLASDTKYVNSILDKFNHLKGEGPTVSEYFDEFESEYHSFNVLSSEDVSYSKETVEMQYSFNSIFKNSSTNDFETESRPFINVSVLQNEIIFNSETIIYLASVA